jgi:hypothetical protein
MRQLIVADWEIEPDRFNRVSERRQRKITITRNPFLLVMGELTKVRLPKSTSQICIEIGGEFGKSRNNSQPLDLVLAYKSAKTP